MRLNMPIVLFGKNEQNTYITHYHAPFITNHDANEQGIMATPAGSDGESESGTNSQGARNCAASGNEESPAADGLP